MWSYLKFSPIVLSLKILDFMNIIFFQLVLLVLVGMVAAGPMKIGKREAEADAAYLYGGYGYLGGYPYGAAYAPYGLGYAAGLVKE